MSADSRAASPASPSLPGQALRLPDSPFTNGGKAGAKLASSAPAQLDSADSRGLEGRASGGAEAAALTGRGPGGAESVPAAQPSRRELRSMSLRPPQQAADSSEPSATASALEASPPTRQPTPGLCGLCGRA